MKYMLSCGFAPRRSPWNLTDSEKIRFFSEQDDFAPSFEFWSVPTILFLYVLPDFSKAIKVWIWFTGILKLSFQKKIKFLSRCCQTFPKLWRCQHCALCKVWTRFPRILKSKFQMKKKCLSGCCQTFWKLWRCRWPIRRGIPIAAITASRTVTGRNITSLPHSI